MGTTCQSTNEPDDQIEMNEKPTAQESVFIGCKQNGSVKIELSKNSSPLSKVNEGQSNLVESNFISLPCGHIPEIYRKSFLNQMRSRYFEERVDYSTKYISTIKEFFGKSIRFLIKVLCKFMLGSLSQHQEMVNNDKYLLMFF